MPAVSELTLHHVLCLDRHGGAVRESDMCGGPVGQRMLNVTGRWASAGTEAVPLLMWPSLASAQADARTATAARGRDVIVLQAGGTNFDRYILPFGPEHAAALMGYLPYAPAAARKLESERKRLMGYVAVVRAASIDRPADDPAAALAAMKKTARTLRASGIGNGSWVSAVQGLTGKRARDIAARVIDGELACDPGLDPNDILDAMAVAKVLAPEQ